MPLLCSVDCFFSLTSIEVFALLTGYNLDVQLYKDNNDILGVKKDGFDSDLVRAVSGGGRPDAY